MKNYKWEEAVAERSKDPPEKLTRDNVEDAAEWCVALDIMDKNYFEKILEIIPPGEVFKMFVEKYPNMAKRPEEVIKYDFGKLLKTYYPNYIDVLELCGVHEDDIPFTPHELPKELFEVYEKVDMRTRLKVANQILENREVGGRQKMDSLNDKGNEFYMLPHKEDVKDIRAMQKKHRLERDHTPSWLNDGTLKFVEDQQKKLGGPRPKPD